MTAPTEETPGTISKAVPASKPSAVAPTAMTPPTLGRIVLYTFRNREGGLTARPAIVVNVVDVTQDGVDASAEDGLVNLRVFTDGSNDTPYHEVIWARHIRYDASGEVEQTWHWPQRMGGAL